LHLYAGLDFPYLATFEFKLVMRGLSRLNPHIPRRVLPITPPLLLRLATVIDFYNSFHLAAWCCFLLAFNLMARKSSLIPPSLIKFDIRKHLLRRDIVLSTTAMIVSIKYSKTIQFGNRLLTVPILAIPDSPLCPVYNFTRLCRLVPASANDSAFSYLNYSGKSFITFSSFTSFLKRLLSDVGIDPSDYSGHSFRRGGASWAFKAQIPGEMIQLIGDWASDSYKLYLYTTLDSKIMVAQRMRDTVLTLSSSPFQ
jgi:hypothetical protein